MCATWACKCIGRLVLHPCHYFFSYSLLFSPLLFCVELTVTPDKTISRIEGPFSEVSIELGGPSLLIGGRCLGCPCSVALPHVSPRDTRLTFHKDIALHWLRCGILLTTQILKTLGLDERVPFGQNLRSHVQI